MVKVLVCYFSKSGHTERMAREIAEGSRAAGAEVDLKPVGEVDPRGLIDYDAVVMGSPTQYGTMSAEAKELIDRSVVLHGSLEGRVGGAFTSSGQRAGGNETTVLDILKAWLIHGMVVLGTSGEDHYGPVAIGEPDDDSIKSCRSYGERVARLTQDLFR